MSIDTQLVNFLMDKLKISDALAQHPFGSFRLTGMQHVMWGKDLVLQGWYVPAAPGKPTAFCLRFMDCREISWKIYGFLDTTDSASFPETDLVSLSLGQGNHRKAAQILTAHFGLSLLYGELAIEGDEPVG